ncbi:hypothetical protein AB205_0205840 [Aquarana catesbeiana]|uniref:Uncharacterized protein n=1 Tax=Aquarana catesbeiana TaxID=8400 RepID=A0A2G9Q5E1_AQUCT|nr:hypothetical protein AB205_0205840 [Aquarana catesbeiana]
MDITETGKWTLRQQTPMWTTRQIWGCPTDDK